MVTQCPLCNGKGSIEKDPVKMPDKDIKSLLTGALISLTQTRESNYWSFRKYFLGKLDIAITITRELLGSIKED